MTQRIVCGLVSCLVLAGFARAQTESAAPQNTPSSTTMQADQPAERSSLGVGIMPHDADPAPGPACGPACNGAAGDDNRFWADGQALLWWVKAQHVPALVSTSPVGTPQATAGVLGTSTGSVLYGNTDVNGGLRPGGDFDVGYWIDAQHRFALTARYFFLTDKESTFDAASSGNPILARPFINATTGAQAALLVAFPGVLNAASINVSTSSRDIFDAEVGGEQVLVGPAGTRYVAMFGYRYFQINESLGINQVATALASTNPYSVPVGSTVAIADAFKTHNDFNGGNFGLRIERSEGNLDVSFLAKLGVGFIHEATEILGSTQTTAVGGTPVTTTGGFLALPTNVGHFGRDDVALIPEFGCTLGYRLNDSWRVFGGYTFLYVSRLLRASDQVDVTVNTTQLPPTNALSGAARPAATLNVTDLWMQGINLGFEFRY